MMSFRASTSACRGVRQVANGLKYHHAGPSRARRGTGLFWAAATIATATLVATRHDSDVKESLRDAWNRSFLLRTEPATQDPPPSKEGAVRMDPDTDVPFPISLNLITPSPPLTLVGLGVRKVSFLRVKVYSAGFYVEADAIKNMRNVPGWHTYSAQHLLTPPTKGDPLHAPQMTGEKLMDSLLDRPIACAVRIVPVRNTDFSHLRDGFTRAIAARQKLARTANLLSEEDEIRIASSTQAIKALFPSQTVPKGKSLVLLKTAIGSLIVEYEGKIMGQVDDPWMAKELMLAYFADKDVISPKLKEDVAHGFEHLIK